ncbi:NAD-dependent epimerase/dehydratase family protein [Alishewanella sp. HL-SH05]|uniref:NAD-dependent epimerase/dehydratase family protein n=1 Tax=Alishewanella sp. HL-SH05 TaxID=3461145 RepID=UPI00404382A0
MPKNILLTGATGFVGSRVLGSLKTQKYFVSVLGRSQSSQADRFFQADFDSVSDYSKSLESIQVLIHIAARAHVMNEQLANPLAAYREVNCLATLNLARQAAAAGVKRFIFISSIKVSGEGTLPGKPYTPFDQTNASEPYGMSKAEAEVGLRQIAADTDMEVVIIRPPLVYGPGVKANFAAMLNLAKKNYPYL